MVYSKSIWSTSTGWCLRYSFGGKHQGHGPAEIEHPHDDRAEQEQQAQGRSDDPRKAQAEDDVEHRGQKKALSFIL